MTRTDDDWECGTPYSYTYSYKEGGDEAGEDCHLVTLIAVLGIFLVVKPCVYIETTTLVCNNLDGVPRDGDCVFRDAVGRIATVDNHANLGIWVGVAKGLDTTSVMIGETGCGFELDRE